MPDDDLLITEIHCPSNNSYGSGYFVAPDLVLTARHVLDKRGEADPYGLAFRVRSIAHFRSPGRPWCEAEILWPPKGRFRPGEAPDIALLRVTPDDVARTLAPSILWGGRNLPEEEFDVRATGFPRLRPGPGGKGRDTQSIRGKVDSYTRLQDQAYDIAITGSVKPLPGEGWEGISGSAVIAEGQLVGVLIARFRDGLADFGAERIEKATGDPDFARHIRAVPAPAPPAVETSPVEINDLICLLDRDNQEDTFREDFKVLMDRLPTAAQCCIAYGGSDHHPHELINRFARETIPRLRRAAGTRCAVLPVSWPPLGADTAGRLTRLRRLLWNFLGDANEPVPDDVNMFRDRLGDESRAFLFSTELTADHLKPENAQLLDAWLAFLDQISARGLARPLVHVLLIRNVNQWQVSQWLADVPSWQPSTGPTWQTKCTRLEEIGFCEWQDIDEWIDNRVPRHAPTFRELAQARSRLHDELEQIIQAPGPFSVTQLKNAIRTIRRT